ncbi:MULTISPECIES: PIG-L deacetylase family protein [Streptomyces]|uniref:Deacetylase n=1 Tax=Streptomyces luteocolor TaxID=285500 RepID=A0A125SZD5_9ACTN|nr:MULTISPECIES: PIG-L deacetylase family protein [Streptomyces]MCF3118639.1 PIG-L family deacetylase [Streptomyces arenae]BAU50939.1 deacetylase [Streptomyces luteocolor]
MTNVLVVAPHPDDDVIGCGASMAKHASEGAEVTVAVVIGRERSLYDTERTDADFADETRKANAALGVHRCVVLDEPSRDFQLTRRVHLDLVRLIRETRPDLVYVPHRHDGDVEHRMVHQLAMESLWMATSAFFGETGEPAPAPRLVLGYEVWAPLPEYQYAEDVTGFVDRKVEAMRAYASQLRHAAWDDAVVALARYRGAVATGTDHAEVFEVLSLGAVPPAP